MKRLAVVPARGGSKRIPDKNIRSFAGQPMIGHILDTAKRTGLFDTIHVSTDSKSIADVATHLGFAPDFSRPAHLAEDATPIMPVVRFVLDQYEKAGHSFDQVWLLMACAPLVDTEDLRGAETAFVDGGGRSLLAVGQYPVPIEWAFTLEADGTMVPCSPGMFSVSSKALEPKYFDAGQFSVFRPEAVRAIENGTDSGFKAYVLPKGTVVDIDDEEDWALAEALFRHKQTKTGLTD